MTADDCFHQWSNEKDLWVNDSPMTCKERLVAQAKIIKDINPLTKIWVYRESVVRPPSPLPAHRYLRLR